ncbi:methyltransferase domain-containing protein [Muricoccus vinaceus]|uniref:Methyltransferase domain-containing protein n=1 Tax=Muricoccus vinaceus TaxID=424704 RepID=A0ABV6IT10_9PROT
MVLRTARSVESLFDAVAQEYETNYSASWYKAHSLLLVELTARGQPVERVLDAGCGTGFLLRQLARNDAALDGVGVDLSGGMIREARKLAQDEGLTKLRYHQANWEDPGSLAHAELTTGHFDLVVCANCLHYFSDPQSALRRMREMLRPGGRILLLDRAADGSPATVLWDLVHRYILRDEVRFYTTQQLRTLAEAAGFTRVETAARLRRVFWKGKLKTSLAVIAAENPFVPTTKDNL